MIVLWSKLLKLLLLAFKIPLHNAHSSCFSTLPTERGFSTPSVKKKKLLPFSGKGIDEHSCPSCNSSLSNLRIITAESRNNAYTLPVLLIHIRLSILTFSLKSCFNTFA